MKIKLILLFILYMVVITCSNNSTSPKDSVNIDFASYSVSPDSGDTYTLFTFTAMSSSHVDDTHSIKWIRWDWESDGIWDTDFTSEKTITHTFSKSGIISVSLEAIDTMGIKDKFSSAIIITQGNKAPYAEFWISPFAGNKNTIFTFIAYVLDHEDSEEDLMVRWDWESDGIWDTEYSTNKTTTKSFNSGSSIVTMEVKDTSGKTKMFTSPAPLILTDAMDLSKGNIFYFRKPDGYKSEEVLRDTTIQSESYVIIEVKTYNSNKELTYTSERYLRSDEKSLFEFNGSFVEELFNLDWETKDGWSIEKGQTTIFDIPSTYLEESWSWSDFESGTYGGVTRKYVQYFGLTFQEDVLYGGFSYERKTELIGCFIQGRMLGFNIESSY